MIGQQVRTQTRASILSVVGVWLHHFIAAACYSKIEHRRLTLDGSGEKAPARLNRLATSPAAHSVQFNTASGSEM